MKGEELLMKIIGKIINIIFKNDENNYRIFVVSNESSRYTLCGYLPQLDEGLAYEFETEEVNHPKYGLQYKVLTYKIYQDKSKESIISYLSSSLFPGIGYIAAEAIYNTLGPNCLDIIINDKNALEEVSKLTPKQRLTIYEKVKENEILESIFVKLYDVGLTNQMAMKLYEKYHSKTLEVIENNPYQLIYDLDGVGFKRADDLARKLGFKENDQERLKALLVYVFNNLSSNYGMTYLTKAQIMRSAYNFALKNTSVTNDELELALNNSINDNKIMIENDKYYLPYHYFDEVNIATKINSLLFEKEKPLNHELYETYLEDFEHMENIEFAPLQKEAIINALENKISIITGGPGTGKTTIIKAIVYIYAALHSIDLLDEISKSKILLCAPTGKAAKRISEKTEFYASTIHRALGYNFDQGYLYDADNLLPHTLVIIDESSMIDNNLASHLLQAVSLRSKIVFVGDAFQLPSIAPGAFLKDLIDSNCIKTTYLETIYRQSEDSGIIALADMVKEGMIQDNIFKREDLKYINCRPDEVVSTVNRIIGVEIAEGYSLQEDIQVLAPMYKGEAGIDELNASISKNFNSFFLYELNHKDKLFHDGDKIIQLVNSKELQILNGDIGILEEKTTAEFDEVVKECYHASFSEKRVKLLDKDFDNLNLAYATSIHKSQGSEYPIVIMPCIPSYYIMLKRKLLYTGLTRAKKRFYLVGDMNSFLNGLKQIEDGRQTSLKMRIGIPIDLKNVSDPDSAFKTYQEPDDGITPKSFM